jgi:hypothetical protein
MSTGASPDAASVNVTRRPGLALVVISCAQLMVMAGAPLISIAVMRAPGPTGPMGEVETAEGTGTTPPEVVPSVA